MIYIFTYIYVIIQVGILAYLGMTSLYLFLFALAGKFYRRPRVDHVMNFRKIAVLIPAYKEDAVILQGGTNALEQDYPEDRFDVVIIADSLLPETLDKLERLPLKVIQVQFEKSTKAKALNKAMEELGDPYDLALVLDSDNLMADGFLKKINAYFEKESRTAVQGHRVAKNTDTSLALLDAISEEINNHIFRKGHRATGLSSAIIGSGMAFRYGLFKSMMASVKAVGGFDKELELMLLKKGYEIGYLDNALVYDEKVSKPETFSRQRRRWLSAQFFYLRKDLFSAIKALIRTGNMDYFDKVLQFIQPPRILLLVSLVLSGLAFTALNYFLNILPVYSYMWIISILICILTFLLAIPVSFYHFRTLRALGSLPRGILLMTGSLLKIRGANNEFIHTGHGEAAPSYKRTNTTYKIHN